MKNKELLCIHCGGFFTVAQENVHVKLNGAIYVVNLYTCNSGEHQLVGEFSTTGYLPAHPKYKLFDDQVLLDVTVNEGQ